MVSLKLADGTGLSWSYHDEIFDYRNSFIVFADLKTEIDKKWELLTLHLPKEVQPQKAELDFVFNGELGLALEGFYRSYHFTRMNRIQMQLNEQVALQGRQRPGEVHGQHPVREHLRAQGLPMLG